MRTFEEIEADVTHAVTTNNPEALERLAKELDATELDNVVSAEAEALSHQARGTALRLRGAYPAALEHYQRALVLYEDLDNRAGVARVISNIGVVHMSTGAFPEALEHYHRALALYEELGNRTGVAGVTGNIGLVHFNIGAFPATLEHYHRALALCEDLGDRAGVARMIGNIGIVHGSIGAYPEALEYYHRALALYEDLGNRAGVANMTGNIGLVHFSTGAYPVALEHFHSTLALQEDLGNRAGVASVTGNIVHTLLSMASYAEAKSVLATMDTMQIDNPGNVIEKHTARASIFVQHGEMSAATAELRTALLIATEHDLRSYQADVNKELRNLALKQNDLASYVEHNNEFTRITEEINGKESTLKIAMQIKQREIDAERKEHEKQIAVLHSTLPKHIADRVARGEVVNDNFEDAAVLFIDVVGFTNNSSLLEANEVVALLQNIFTEFDAICAKHNVTKIKTIGDAYMAVAFPVAENAAGTNSPGYNLPENFSRRISPGHFSHHVSLASASIEIINSKFTWSHNSAPVEFRIGLHCGPVVAGVLGTERMQYDVWGDTVNVASRMESTSEPGRIHVSEAFADASQLTFVPRGEIEVKGKGKMQTFWLSSGIKN